MLWDCIILSKILLFDVFTNLIPSLLFEILFPEKLLKKNSGPETKIPILPPWIVNPDMFTYEDLINNTYKLFFPFINTLFLFKPTMLIDLLTTILSLYIPS